jgi:uncharacterized protein with GYD domain
VHGRLLAVARRVVVDRQRGLGGRGRGGRERDGGDGKAYGGRLRQRAEASAAPLIPPWIYIPAMPTYVMLSTLSPEGVQTIKSNPARILEVNKELEQLGVTVKAQWAVLGRYDFVNVIEAPDEKTVARVSMELGSRGTARYETLSAIPIDDFIAAL